MTSLLPQGVVSVLSYELEYIIDSYNFELLEIQFSTKEHPASESKVFLIGN